MTNNDQISATATVTLLPAAPAFFWLTGNKYIVATHADGALAGPTTLIAGVTTPVMPGETIVLYGTGFGVTSPRRANNATFPAPLSLATLPTITIGGAAATVTYAGLIEPGVFQTQRGGAVSLPAGDAAVVATVGGQQSQANAFLSVM